MRAALLAIGFAAWCTQSADAKTWRTSLLEGYQEEWKFLAKFAFSQTTAEEPGVISLRAWTFMPGQQVLLYRNDVWFDAYNAPSGQASACLARASVADQGFDVPKGRFYGEAGEVVRTFVVQHTPEFWFLALARCGEWVEQAYANDTCTGSRPNGELIPNGLFLYFELTMLNPGGYWRAHFSADEQLLFEFHLVLGVLYVLLGLVYIVVGLRHWEDPTLIAKLQWCGGVAAFSTLQHAMLINHYMDVAETGEGHEWAVKTAETAESIATILYTLFLLILSKGWMVTRTRLKQRTRILQGLVTLTLTSIWAVLFVLDIVARDPAATYHKYESDGAKVLVVLRMLITGWFSWCVHRSYYQALEAGGSAAVLFRGLRPAQDTPQFFLFLAAIGATWLLSFAVYTMLAETIPNYMVRRPSQI